MRHLYFMLVVVFSAVAHAATWETGSMTVEFKDVYGRQITDATLQVRVLNREGWTRGGESDYKVYEAQTDDNGVATVTFRFFHPHFTWSVITPSHYSSWCNFQDEYFKCQVEESEYFDTNTNTVEGLSRYNELKRLEDAGDDVAYIQKFEPKMVLWTESKIRRSVSFYPKKNPQPMCSYVHSETYALPMPVDDFDIGGSLVPKMVKYVKDQIGDVEQLIPVELDMQSCRFLPPWGARHGSTAGKISDFRITRYHTVTNGVSTYYGWLEFAPGCGAYKMQKTEDKSFVSTYGATTNAVFLNKIPYRYYYIDGKYVADQELLREDECMILRTRVVLDDNNSVAKCNYSKIIGAMTVGKKLSFKALIFNPRVNDSNLEFDMKRNMAEEFGGEGRSYCP